MTISHGATIRHGNIISLKPLTMILQMTEPSISQRYNECSLSKRECEVLRLVAHEYSTPQVADMLYISEHTVMSHRKNIMIKLNAKNTAGMVRRGFEVGVLYTSSEK